MRYQLSLILSVVKTIMQLLRGTFSTELFCMNKNSPTLQNMHVCLFFSVMTWDFLECLSAVEMKGLQLAVMFCCTGHHSKHWGLICMRLHSPRALTVLSHGYGTLLNQLIFSFHHAMRGESTGHLEKAFHHLQTRNTQGSLIQPAEGTQQQPVCCFRIYFKQFQQLCHTQKKPTCAN